MQPTYLPAAWANACFGALLHSPARWASWTRCDERGTPGRLLLVPPWLTGLIEAQKVKGNCLQDLAFKVVDILAQYCVVTVSPTATSGEWALTISRVYQSPFKS